MAGSSLIGNLAVTLGLNTAAFSKGATAAERRADTMKKRMSGVATSLKGFGAALAGSFALTALAGAVTRSLEYASSLGEVAQQLGVTTTELQQYRYAASQAGIEQSTMDAGLSKLTRTMGEAMGGSKPLIEAFGKLGISMKDIQGKTAGEVLPLIAEGLAKIPDAARRAAIEVDLFGKAGQKLDTLLAGGAKGVNDLRQAAQDLGLVMTPEQIAAADEAADKLSKLKQVLEAKLAVFVADNAAAISKFADDLAKFATSPGLKDTITGIGSMFKKLGELRQGMAEFTRTHESLADQFARAGRSISFNLAKAGAAITQFASDIQAGVGKAIAAAQALAIGVASWLGARLALVIDAAKQKIQSLGEKFKWLWDVVVGHSYIPDMVTAIGQHMARLDALMVQPTTAAVGKTAQAFRELQQAVSGILARLFPDQAADNRLSVEIRQLEEYAKKAGWSVDQLTEALHRLNKERNGVELGAPDPMELEGVDDLPETPNSEKGADDLLDEYGEWSKKTLPDFTKSAKWATAEVIQSFAHMAESVVGSLRNMVSAFKNGDIWDKITAIAGVIGQVIGGIQGFGGLGGRQGGGFGGFRAKGGPVVPGKSYVVGENGPELMTTGARGFVTPSNDNGGGSRMEIVPSKYFDVVVDGRVVRTGAPMMQAAAASGSAGALSTLTRRQARTLP